MKLGAAKTVSAPPIALDVGDDRGFGCLELHAVVLAVGYRLLTRADTGSADHHMTSRMGEGVEGRLGQTSLYRPDLELVVVADG